MHVNSKWDQRAYLTESINKYAELGLEVHITEFDVNLNDMSWSSQQAQAKVYEHALNGCLDAPTCTAFLTWGFTDKFTWLGTNHGPLPFDANYNKKPAYNTMLETLNKRAKNKPAPTPTPTPTPTPEPTPPQEPKYLPPTPQPNHNNHPEYYKAFPAENCFDAADTIRTKEECAAASDEWRLTFK